MLQNATNSGLYQSIAGGQAVASQAVQYSEIESELNRLRENIVMLDGVLGELVSRLYQALAPEVEGKASGQSVRPSLSSPLGEALRVENYKLESLCAAVNAVRARVQL